MALVEGVKYGLSAADNNPGPGSHHPPNLTLPATGPAARKSVVFVKLTDSALKAIEDYLRSQHKTGGQQPATLQFLGNEGQIHIPSSQAYKGPHSFDFSLSSNADIEGPQGSFECIQRCGPSSLESMGNVPYKLRIHAKDDVYETTRQRMNALEETRKHDCSAKEIKPSGPDIGRKVRRKETKATIPVPAASQYRREPSPIYNNQNKPFLQANNHGSRINGGSTNHNNITANNHNPVSHAASNQSNILNKNTNLNGHSGPKPYNGSDITRRPLRDRLIHLLALKAFKKPEILSKMHKDGMKEKDKKLLMPLLSQVAVLKNNEYILNRGIWNDIQEDWPFYTEQEKQIMKRRKPQNLTPPGSDSSVSSLSSLSPRSSASTSSGSGLSPPSTYSQLPGTKPTMTQGGIMMNGVYMDGSIPVAAGKRSADGMDSVNEDLAGNKRLRISHFKRPNCATPNANISATNGRHEKDSPPGHVYKDSQSSYPNHSPTSQHSIRPYAKSSHAVSNHPRHHGDQLYSPKRNSELTQRSPSTFPVPGRTPDTIHGDSLAQHCASDMVLSPTYAHQTDDLGHYPPYAWAARNANHETDVDPGKLPDSDETDSVDSGNGSSTSSSNGSAHHILSGNIDSNATYQHMDFGNGDNSEVTKEESERAPSNFSPTPTPAFKSGYMSHERSSHEIGTNFNVSHYPDPDPTEAESLDNNHAQLDRDETNTRSSSVLGGHTSSKDRERTKERTKDKDSRRERDGRKERDREHADYTESSASLSKYTQIRTAEQKSRYKAEFNADYKEYRKLHAVIDKVSKRFAHLAEILEQTEHGSQDYENVKQQIVEEYNSKKSSPEYMDAKQKFSFLHDKLSHIKKLVIEYDNANPKRRRSSDYASQEEYISH